MGLLIASDRFFTAAGFECNARYLTVETTVVDGLLRPCQRFDGECILGVARKVVAIGRILSECTHQPPFVIGVFETIGKHMIQ